MHERIEKIEADLAHAHENADRSAQTRLFIHHVPWLIARLRECLPEQEVEIEVEEEEERLALMEDEMDLNLAEEAKVEEKPDTVLENDPDAPRDPDVIVGEGGDPVVSRIDEASADDDSDPEPIEFPKHDEDEEWNPEGLKEDEE